MPPGHRLVSRRRLPSGLRRRQAAAPTLRQRGSTMTPDTSRWRSSDTYDHLDALESPDLAWEWLRRNTEYQKDFAEAQSPSLMRELRRKWGLQFFRPAVAESWRAAGALVRGGGYQRHNAHARARPPAGGRQSFLEVARRRRPLRRTRRAFPAWGGQGHLSGNPAHRRSRQHATCGGRAA